MTDPSTPPAPAPRDRRTVVGVLAVVLGALLLALSALSLTGDDDEVRWSAPDAEAPGSVPDGDDPGPPATTIPAIDPAGPALPVEQPNIVLVQTDDQTLESMRVMEATRRLLGDGGTTFTQAVSGYPLCCPARAALLTGQLSHNNGVLFNKPPTGGYESFTGQDATLATALQEAGYRTLHVGKYLNGYGKDDPTEVPPGWDRWQTLVDPSTYRYFRFQMNTDGVVARHPPGDYQTDVLFDLAVAGIEAEAARGPFFLALDTLAPHVDTTTGDEAETIGARTLKSAVPAPRHAGRFADEPLPDDPAIDVVSPEHPPFVVGREPIGADGLAQLTRTYQAELESLLAVDEGVERLVAALEAAGVLDRTIVVFTSDNGFLHGQHRVVQAKYYGWEPSVRVPLLVRGPGITAGATNASPVSTVDLTATLLDVAGARPPRLLDGRSLVPLLVDPSTTWERAVLIGSGENVDGLAVYHGVRTPSWKYLEYEQGGVRELYDLEADPFELVNLVDDPGHAEVVDELSSRLVELRDCAGATCR